GRSGGYHASIKPGSAQLAVPTRMRCILAPPGGRAVAQTLPGRVAGAAFGCVFVAGRRCGACLPLDRVVRWTITGPSPGKGKVAPADSVQTRYRSRATRAQGVRSGSDR